jgi:hypothetical protein
MIWHAERSVIGNGYSVILDDFTVYIGHSFVYISDARLFQIYGLFFLVSLFWCLTFEILVLLLFISMYRLQPYRCLMLKKVYVPHSIMILL